jgi:hypothetical protein
LRACRPPRRRGAPAGGFCWRRGARGACAPRPLPVNPCSTCKPLIERRQRRGRACRRGLGGGAGRAAGSAAAAEGAGGRAAAFRAARGHPPPPPPGPRPCPQRRSSRLPRSRAPPLGAALFRHPPRQPRGRRPRACRRPPPLLSRARRPASSYLPGPSVVVIKQATRSSQAAHLARRGCLRREAPTGVLQGFISGRLRSAHRAPRLPPTTDAFNARAGGQRAAGACGAAGRGVAVIARDPGPPPRGSRRPRAAPRAPGGPHGHPGPAGRRCAARGRRSRALRGRGTVALIWVARHSGEGLWPRAPRPTSPAGQRQAAACGGGGGRGLVCGAAARRGPARPDRGGRRSSARAVAAQQRRSGVAAAASRRRSPMPCHAPHAFLLRHHTRPRAGRLQSARPPPPPGYAAGRAAGGLASQSGATHAGPLPPPLAGRHGPGAAGDGRGGAAGVGRGGTGAARRVAPRRPHIAPAPTGAFLIRIRVVRADRKPEPPAMFPLQQRMERERGAKGAPRGEEEKDALLAAGGWLRDRCRAPWTPGGRLRVPGMWREVV